MLLDVVRPLNEGQADFFRKPAGNAAGSHRTRDQAMGTVSTKF